MANPVQKKQLELSMELLGPNGPYTVGLVNTPHHGSVKGFIKGPKLMGEYLKEAFQAHPDQECVVFKSERWTGKQLEAACMKVAKGLRDRFNVRPGDRVGICMQNCSEWVITFLSGLAMGAIVVPLNSWWKTEELQFALNDSGIKVLVCDQKRYTFVQPLLQQNKQLQVITVGTPKSSHDFSRLNSHGSAATASDLYYLNRDRVDYPAAIMYTSGTTGNPKGVVQTHRGMCEQMCMGMFAVDMGQRIQKLFPDLIPAPQYQPAIICPVPLFHVTGSHHLLLASLGVGRKVVVMDRWDPSVALKLIETERLSMFTGVPTMVQDIMEHPNFHKTDTSSVLYAGGGGAATPPANVDKADKLFKNARPGQGYGMTELNGGMTSNFGDDYVLRPTSAGRPYPNVDIRVVNPGTEKECGVDERGELRVKGAQCMYGYWNNTLATISTVDSNGYVKTGDVATVDAEGFVYIVDRIKDIVIRGGENISCSEVEACAAEHPEVMEACVFSVPDTRLGEEVGLAVQLKPGGKCTPKELKSWIAATNKIAVFKQPQPKNIFITTQPLARGATGKTQRRDVRQQMLKLKGASKL